MCGIYKITNTINGLCYIGQSIDIITRWNKHRNYPLSHSHYPLYQAFSQFGINNFLFEILEECSEQDLDKKEIFYISFYDSYYNGYNQTKGGSGAGHIVKISNEDLEVIYDLLLNSSITQNDIAKMFFVGADTISEINQGKTRRKDNFIYPLRKNKKEKNYCIDCGKEILAGSVRCNKCNFFKSRIVERPDRDTLKQKIRTQSFLSIGKEYSVTDNTIRKWCTSYNLPSKKTDIKQISDEDWNKI